jgi:lactate dehydrogenase-like 2-hydroxyacid dehydrogenase
MKTLIMGLGGIGQRHLRNLRMLRGNDVDIIGYDPRPNPPVLTDQLKIEEGSSLEKKYNLTIHLPGSRPSSGPKTTGCICLQSHQSAHPGGDPGSPRGLRLIRRETAFS